MHAFTYACIHYIHIEYKLQILLLLYIENVEITLVWLITCIYIYLYNCVYYNSVQFKVPLLYNILLYNILLYNILLYNSILYNSIT